MSHAQQFWHDTSTTIVVYVPFRTMWSMGHSQQLLCMSSSQQVVVNGTFTTIISLLCMSHSQQIVVDVPCSTLLWMGHAQEFWKSQMSHNQFFSHKQYNVSIVRHQRMQKIKLDEIHACDN